MRLGSVEYGRALTVQMLAAGRFRARETGSEWDLLGRAQRGPLTGQSLTPLAHGNHVWFARATFQPETRRIQ